jgi:hypothetical protein
MNKKLIFFAMLVGILALNIVFVSCGNSNNSLNGTWESNNQYSPGVFTFNGSNYEFIYHPNPDASNHKGTFSLNREKTKITFNQTHNRDPWRPNVLSFEQDINISGNSFTIGSHTYSKTITNVSYSIEPSSNDSSAIVTNTSSSIESSSDDSSAIVTNTSSSVVSSSNKSSELLGKWTTNPEDYPEYFNGYEFFSNGIVIYQDDKGEWKIENDMVVFTFNDGYIFAGEISGSNMTLHDKETGFFKGILIKVR